MPEVTEIIDTRAIADTGWVQALAELDGLAQFEMSEKLFAQAKVSRDAGELSMEALYSVLGAICSYHYKGEDRLEPYGPFIVMNEGRSAMPADLRDSDLSALSQMLPSITLAAVRARVADVLWIRRRDHQAARTAVESYVEAAQGREEHWEHEALDRLERAMQLAAMLGRGGVELRDLPTRAALGLLGEDPPLSPGYEAQLIRMLISWGLTEELRSTYDRKIAYVSGDDAPEDEHLRRGLYELISAMATALGDPACARDYRVRVAESWVTEAEASLLGESPSHLRAVSLMEFAIKEYRAIGGCQSRVDELHKMMLEWQSHIGDEMQSFSATIDLSDVVAQSEARVRGKALPQALVGMAMVHGFRDVVEIRAEVERLVDEHPLQYLFSRSQLNEKGRAVARPASIGGGDDETRIAVVDAEMDSQFMTTIGIVVHGGIEPARRILVLEHAVRLDELVGLVGPSPFIPPGHEGTYVKGLWLGLSGDYASAAMVLSPELENALREQMAHAGVLLPRLSDDVTQAERSLNVVLDHEKAEEVFGADKLFALRALLISPFGANLRNRIAHGLMSDGELSGSATAYMWWLALRLAIEPMIRVEHASEEPASARALD